MTKKLPIINKTQAVDISLPASNSLLTRGLAALQNKQTAKEPSISVYGNIDNCKWKFSYECPQRWVNLTSTEDDSIRFCSICKKNVYACYNDESVFEHIKNQDCVAIMNDFDDNEWLGMIDLR